MAAPGKRFVPRDSSRRRIVIYVAVGVFVVVDILLIIWALNSATAAVEARRTDAAVESVLPPAPSVSPSPSEAVADTPVAAVAPTRILSALDETTAWRATTGPCPGSAATPELTTDAGATWKVTDASDAGIAAVQAIVVDSPEVASFVGFDVADCAPQAVRTFVAGDDFAPYPELPDATWFIDPGAAGTISAPGGEVTAPCATPVAIASLDDTVAAVLCADQTVHSTLDGGQSWSARAAIPGAINLARTDSGYIAVTAGAQECAGVQVAQMDALLALGASGCLPLDLPMSTLPGTVAIAQAGDAVWVWAGDELWRSLDGGATWQ